MTQIIKVMAVRLTFLMAQLTVGAWLKSEAAPTGKPQSGTLTFHRGDLGWFACLESQPELANDRRSIKTIQEKD